MTVPLNPNIGPDDLPVPFEEALEDEVTPITISLRPTVLTDEREQPVIDQKLDLKASDGYAFSIGITFPDGSDSDHSDDQSPGLPEQTDLFSQWLFDAASFLDRIENISRSKEPFCDPCLSIEARRLSPIEPLQSNANAEQLPRTGRKGT